MSYRSSSRKRQRLEDPFTPKRINPRIAAYCLEFGLESNLCCSGCIKFAQSINIPLESYREDEFFSSKIKQALIDRHETHTSHQYACRQPWTWPEKTYKGTGDEVWIDNVKSFVQKYHGRINILVDTRTPAVNPPRSTVSPELEEGELEGELAPRELNYRQQQPLQPPPPPPPDDDPDDDPDDTAEQPPPDDTPDDDEQPQKKERKANFRSVRISSQGKNYDIEVPNSHVPITKNELTILKRAKSKLDQLTGAFDRKRFMMNTSDVLRSHLASALAIAPALPIKMAAIIFPLVVGGFLAHHGLIDDIQTFVQSFPSESYLRAMMLDQSAECSLSLGRKLQAKQVFLSCDKGNKKGIGHLVKFVSWWEEGVGVVIQMIDADASDGTHDDVAAAIKKSLSKLRCPFVFRLCGQCTDSGGGGVLEGLARALQKLGLCMPEYLISACCIHSLLLQLSGPTKEYIGEGGIDKRNAMQLLHSIYDLQESLEWPEYEKALNLAQAWTNECLENGIDESKGSTEDKSLARKFNKIKSFRTFERYEPPPLEGKKKQQWEKCPACVLTRWGFVGKAASWGWKHYLMLLKLTQIIINKYNSDSKPNKIASGLQALLLEEEIFCDLALLKCFHESYFNSHLGWLMKSTDLTGHPGFQSHQMAIRYNVMDMELSDILSTMLSTHEGFSDFRNALTSLDGPAVEKKKTNSQKFVEMSIASLHKHFQRWIKPDLMPAALMSEVPLARIVADAIIGLEKVTPVVDMMPDCIPFKSEVHNRWIDLVGFRNWLDLHYQSDSTLRSYDGVQDAAAALLDGVDFRCPKDPNVVADVSQKFLWWRFLPLASQSQFVETGVKECKLVSTTGREEEMRSAYTVVRSSMLLTTGGIKSMGAHERLISTVKSINDHVTYQRELGKEPSYQANLKKIRTEIHKNHFKHERMAKKRESIEATAEINRKENKRQKTSGVDDTAAGAGLISWSKVLAKHKSHTNDIKTELAARGVTIDDLKTFTSLKNALKANEEERVKATDEYIKASGDDQKKMLGVVKKAFKAISEAKFLIG